MQGQAAIFVLIELLPFIAVSLLRSSSSLTIGETCSTSSNNCNEGFICSTCPANGNTRPRCSRVQPTNPTSKVKGLPFNKYSWLTTHNSFALSGSKSELGSDIITPTNQEDTVTAQLENGVRGLMLDMYDFNDDIWLCHSFGGKCLNVTSFQPAIIVLKEIQVFLEENPSEIVTIFIEDYVTSPQGLTKVFDASGLSEYWFPVSQMPQKGEDWPLVDDMVEQNQRLVVFTSKEAKEVSEGIAYEWRYVVENQYGNDGMRSGSCPSRSESLPMNTQTISLVLQNYFPDNPNVTASCVDNSAALLSTMDICYEAAGNRWPNFVAVDFYMRNDGGGVAEAVDRVNGRLTCNCESIAYCKSNGSSTTCEMPELFPPPPAQLTPESTSTNPINDSPICRSLQLQWLIVTIFAVTLLLGS
ncbi:PREDICTED: PI-PLC X domain-containing protein At5g67130-like [Ipomoea nil]|uniref:PI-PLC X domain-containing protein At5g67130-like n=1 Tax=Ipomoea nil TaxID=35883 RepID=UPI000901239C|nr:PREDICTED: PI-PLC X domain-containing protein At5g67130-like [Ipomoea nil]